MAVSLSDSRRLSDFVLKAPRPRAVRGCELGFTQAEVVQILGVSPESGSRRRGAYCEDGVERLPGDRTGRHQGAVLTFSMQRLTTHEDDSDAVIKAGVSETIGIDRFPCESGDAPRERPHIDTCG